MKDISYSFLLSPESSAGRFAREYTIDRLKSQARAVQFLCASKVELSQEPSISDDGTLWQVTFRAVVPDSAIVKWNGLRAGIAVVDSHGGIIKIGGSSVLPKLVVTPYTEAYVVSATFDTAEPLSV